MKLKLISIAILLNFSNVIGQPDSLKLAFEYYTLDNGLEVVLQEDDSFEDISVEFWLKDGISYDKEHQFGFAHFFEHVMPFAEMDSIDRKRLAENRTGSNAQVKKDFSRFYVKVKREALELALEMASGRLKTGANKISSKRVEYQRGRVLAEIERNSKKPEWSAPGGMAIYMSTFGSNHPYGSSGYGLVENNERFKLEEFRQRYKEIVHAKNIVLFVVGNFNSTETKQLIKDNFNSIPVRELQKKDKTVKAQPSANIIEMRAPSAKDTLNTLVLSWPIPSWGDKESGALEVLSLILNEKLKENVQLQRLTRSSKSAIELYQFAGKLSIMTSFSEKKDLPEIGKIVSQSMRNLLSNSSTDSEIDQAKMILIEEMADSQKKLGFGGSRTELLGQGVLYHKDPNFYFLRLMDQLKIKDDNLRSVGLKWLKASPAKVIFWAN